ncbi:hypothetical protein BX667DRAFT_64200 [Coemansia mojavensis]|nr:hypothetical protein BX667DRAFT_64200 [Coemansia mojavensis]
MSSLQLPGWLHCNKCHVFANTADIRLYILECTHIACKRCLSISIRTQTAQPKRINANVPCPLCATICAAKCIGNDALPAEVQPFLDENMVLSELDRLRYCVQFQLSNQNEAIQVLQAKLNKQSKLMRQAQSYIEQMQREQQPRPIEWHPRIMPSDNQQPLRMRSTEYRQARSREPVPHGSHIRFPHQQMSPAYTRASSLVNSHHQQPSVSRLGASRRPLYSPLLAPPQANNSY